MAVYDGSVVDSCRKWLAERDSAHVSFNTDYIDTFDKGFEAVIHANDKAHWFYRSHRRAKCRTQLTLVSALKRLALRSPELMVKRRQVKAVHRLIHLQLGWLFAIEALAGLMLAMGHLVPASICGWAGALHFAIYRIQFHRMLVRLQKGS